MPNAFIVCDLFENLRKIMKQTEKEALKYTEIGSFYFVVI